MNSSMYIPTNDSWVIEYDCVCQDPLMVCWRPKDWGKPVHCLPAKFDFNDFLRGRITEGMDFLPIIGIFLQVNHPSIPSLHSIHFPSAHLPLFRHLCIFPPPSVPFDPCSRRWERRRDKNKGITIFRRGTTSHGPIATQPLSPSWSSNAIDFGLILCSCWPLWANSCWANYLLFMQKESNGRKWWDLGVQRGIKQTN